MCKSLHYGRHCCCCNLHSPPHPVAQAITQSHLSNNCSGWGESGPGTDFTTPEQIRKLWEELDASILILYILLTQLFLLLFGTHRTKATKTRIVVSVSAWLMYLICELLALISLGKLSKVEGGKAPASPLIMWAPTILFYLGGPDTLTILTLEENSMWVKHFIGLVTLGFRTSYVLHVSWTEGLYPYLALLMLFPGMIKYGDRVRIMWLRSQGKPEGFIRLDKKETSGKQPPEGNKVTGPGPLARPGTKAEEVVQAYSCFQFLNSPARGHKLDTSTKDYESVFKAIEIELGFLYDALFSKMGSIFTVWGCILRFISFSSLVVVLVLVLVMKEPSHVAFKIDFPISLMLLIGAIILDVAGILRQIVSDWAVVWTSNYRFQLMKPIFSLQECFLSKRKRWSGLMGQFDLLNFCTKDEPTRLIGVINTFCGHEYKVLQMKMKFSSNFEEVRPKLKYLVFEYLRRKYQNNPGGNQDSTRLQEFEWTIKLKFYESIIIWHIATENCYTIENPESITEKENAIKALSRYMMYLLVICPRFPFCTIDDANFMKAYDEVKEVCKGKVSKPPSRARNLPPGKKHSPGIENEPGQSQIVVHIQNLTNVLKEKDDRWEIMSSMWLTLLCIAARTCTAEQHARELRHGVEFISHVWLLLVHLGEAEWLGKKASLNLEGAGEKLFEKVIENMVDFV
ncbi:hypothetical protein NMG60_11023248 [Bertholletia excelsa]